MENPKHHHRKGADKRQRYGDAGNNCGEYYVKQIDNMTTSAIASTVQTGYRARKREYWWCDRTVTVTFTDFGRLSVSWASGECCPRNDIGAGLALNVFITIAGASIRPCLSQLFSAPRSTVAIVAQPYRRAVLYAMISSRGIRRQTASRSLAESVTARSAIQTAFAELTLAPVIAVRTVAGRPTRR